MDKFVAGERAGDDEDKLHDHHGRRHHRVGLVKLKAAGGWQYLCMDIFAEITDERRVLADLLSGLTPQQRATRSLCSAWTVQDVSGHMIVSLEVSLPKFALTMLACGGSFDRANDRLARKQAQRPFEEIVGVLHNKADKRFTPPGAGPEAPLTDVLVHGLDICWPLEIDRKIPVPAQRWITALTFLTTRAANGLVVKGAMDGLRFEAQDVDWAHGGGPAVRGSAAALLLVLTGRAIALGHLHGEGVTTLQHRVSQHLAFG